MLSGPVNLAKSFEIQCIAQLSAETWFGELTDLGSSYELPGG